MLGAPPTPPTLPLQADTGCPPQGRILGLLCITSPWFAGASGTPGTARTQRIERGRGERAGAHRGAWEGRTLAQARSKWEAGRGGALWFKWLEADGGRGRGGLQEGNRPPVGPTVGVPSQSLLSCCHNHSVEEILEQREVCGKRGVAMPVGGTSFPAPRALCLPPLRLGRCCLNALNLPSSPPTPILPHPPPYPRQQD